MKDCQHSEPVKNEQERQDPACSTGCCCGLDGPGGKLRVVLMVLAVVVTVALMAHGFSA
jgi:hypothetical protein